jgi:hypothetical protein
MPRSSSASAKCVITVIDAVQSAVCSLASAWANSSAVKPSRCMPVSSFRYTGKHTGRRAAISASTCHGACSTGVSSHSANSGSSSGLIEAFEQQNRLMDAGFAQGDGTFEFDQRKTVGHIF